MYKYGYMLINSYFFTSGGSTYLVDDYSLDLSFSIRKTSSTATNCLRVRRSSDNAEQDIGFNGDDLDTSALTTFVGANDGFVVKWYNQGSGGATYDGSQTVAGTQPQIVSSGTVITSVNGYPAIKSVSADYFDMSSYTLGTEITEASVISRPTNGITTITLGYLGVQIGGLYWYSNNYLYKQVYNLAGLSQQTLDTGSGDFVYFMSRTSGLVLNSYLNDVSKISFTEGGTTGDWTRILQNSYPSTGSLFQEINFTNTDETSNKTDIQDNINNYYSIY